MRGLKLYLIRVLYLYNYRAARKFIGGTWYRYRTALPMQDIWLQKHITSCQAYIIETEHHPLPTPPNN